MNNVEEAEYTIIDNMPTVYEAKRGVLSATKKLFKGVKQLAADYHEDTGAKQAIINKRTKLANFIMPK